MSVLIYTENWDGKFKKSTFELVSYANEIAKQNGSQTIAVVIGSVEDNQIKALQNYGVNKIIKTNNPELKDFSAVAYSAVISQIGAKENVKFLVMANNYTGRAIAPRLAVKLNAGLVSGAVQIPSSYSPFTVRKRVYSGKATADVIVNSEIKIITLNQNTFHLTENQFDAQIEEFTANLPANSYTAKPIEVSKTTGKISVNDAEILVSGGRGLKGPENWGMIEEMATILGAATCCSRPVTDLNWRPHHEHVGQTGKVVAPNLYIAIGISGSIQHLAGVNGSKLIVCINTDKEAPFFEAADYGIIGDAFDVVPKLNAELKKFKEGN